MKYRAVIFDLDGTLYDKSRLPLWLVLSNLARTGWLKAERRVRKELKGMDFKTEEAFYEAFFADAAALSGTSAECYRKWYFEKYMPSMAKALSRHYKIYPWVEGTFSRLRSEGIVTAVFSDYGSVNEKLAALGFDPSWADVVADAPSFGGLKPSAASFLRVAERIGIPPSECLMVGDREDTDGDGARAVGMPFLIYEGEEQGPRLD